MNLRTKLGFYLVLLLAMAALGQRFLAEYGASTSLVEDPGSGNLADVRIPEYGKPPAEPTAGSRESKLGFYGFGFFSVIVAFGLLAGRDVSLFFGSRALKALALEDNPGVADPQYDHAEEAWAKGQHLEAIQLLRDYLVKNPRELHASLRIAEIYEKDLQNHLAAALEYEEVLEHKLNPERWGWAAVHLCNLYSSKLGQHDKAIALLRRLNEEHPRTSAASKARKRLSEIDGTPYEEPDQSAPETEPPPADPLVQEASPLPLGFKMKK